MGGPGLNVGGCESASRDGSYDEGSGGFMDVTGLAASAGFSYRGQLLSDASAAGASKLLTCAFAAT